MISKEKFCEYINKLQAAWDTDMKIHDLARDAKSEFLGSDMSYLFCEVCELLELVMGCEYEDISYFCIEADFGRNWHPGMVIDKEGNDVDLSSAEKLYDFLVNESGG